MSPGSGPESRQAARRGCSTPPRTTALLPLLFVALQSCDALSLNARGLEEADTLAGPNFKTSRLAGSSRTQYCSTCCNDGEKYVQCLDVEACASRVKQDGKYAFILSHYGQPNARFKFLPYISSMRDQVRNNPKVHIDIILQMTSDDAKRLRPEHHAELKKNKVKLMKVDWNVPPGMMYRGESPFNHYRSDMSAWCGPQDLMRMHAFNLTQYDAVAYYDSDIEFWGDVLPVFRCASAGNFLTTGGGIGVPLNIGFFAMRPDHRMLHAAEYFARNYNYSVKTGWGESSWEPAKVKYAGGECGQGFFHTLFYMKKSVAAQTALDAVGIGSPRTFQAHQIDKCIWNYQTSFQCPADFNCKHVRMHHKPKKPGKNHAECLKKYQQRERQQQELLALEGRSM